MHKEQLRVFPLFKQKVYSVSVDDCIGDALKIMYENSFSQLPIYRGDKFIDLLTNNTISRWLGSSVDEEIFSLRETSIKEVLKFTENPDSYFFLNSDASLSEAIEKFQYFESIGKPLDAVLITQNGKATEELLGIITFSDFPKIMLELSKC
jgi:predicted transcriptional regulator